MSNETKVRQCWKCDFFIQADAEAKTGKCVRHAPTKAGELRGDGIATTIDGLESFPNITDATIISCGQFKASTVPVPSIPA